MAWSQIQPPSHPKGQRAAGLEEKGGWEWTSKPMREEREDGEGAAADNQQQWTTLNR